MLNVTTANIITVIRGLIKDVLNSNGRDAFAYDTDASFKLSEARISSATIIVYVNGTDITTSSWSYNSDTNKITITSSLVSADTVTITYSFYEKYSDTEITSYIKANLVRFTQYQYKKYFYMNDSNVVVTLNGVNPTVEEGNLIAIVTAIDIDPQNIEIKTRDFTVTPTEKKSKTELIAEAIRGFSKGYISLDFLEVEE